ncbi:MAG TPA: PEGA domain-containing protein [Ignavibacteria bacterium]|nr:PEGA domain-containing protein [Ignavibacteria bacterium]
MANNAFSQDDSTKHTLTIYSNFDSSIVKIDTNIIGYTPLINYKLPQGEYEINIMKSSNYKDWDEEIKSVKINLTADTLLTVNFRYYYFIDTDPDNAQVLNNNIFLGLTPLRYLSETSLTGKLLFKKDGFFNQELSIVNNQYDYFAKLRKTNGEANISEVMKDRQTQFKSPRNLPMISLFSAAVLGTGFAAYRTKTVANNYYDEYVRTQDVTLLDKSNKEDVYFYVSIGLMQAALAGLIYYLFIK